MNQKSVLITGSSGGVGQAAVKLFIKEGWLVIGIDKAPAPGDYPDDAIFIQADISQDDDWQKIANQLKTDFDNLEAIVNNAAIQITKPIIDMTVEEWDQVIHANLRSVFLSVKYLYPLLKQGGGAIVNVSSVHAIATSKNIAAYAASKGGMLALTRALAIELAPDNIRVNTILPGAVKTEMLKAGLNRDHAGIGSLQERLENLAQKTVSGKIGEPEEIAQGILFLADKDRSSFITGQPLVVDGGATTRLSTE